MRGVYDFLVGILQLLDGPSTLASAEGIHTGAVHLMYSVPEEPAALHLAQQCPASLNKCVCFCV